MVDTINLKLTGIAPGEPHHALYNYLNRYQADLKAYHTRKENHSNRIIVNPEDLLKGDFELPTEFKDKILIQDEDNPKLIKTVDLDRCADQMPFDQHTLDLNDGTISKTLITLAPDTFIWKNFKTGKEQQAMARGSVTLPTHHYHIAFSINEQAKIPYIKLDFSIPKFLYGTNVFQFVEHFDNRNVTAKNNRSFKYQAAYLYPRLMAFLDYFFAATFPHHKINRMMVQVTRLDFCFNQVFGSETDARTYLEYLGGIQKKYSRKKAKFQQFSSGQGDDVFLSRNAYAINIYHKGDEFKNHDAKQLRRINKQYMKRYGQPLYSDLDNLQQFANRIVRYEYRMRNAKLSQIWKRYCFRKDCPKQKERVKYSDWLHNNKFKFLEYTPEQFDKRKKKPFCIGDIEISPTQREFQTKFKSLMQSVCDFNISNIQNEFHHETPRNYLREYSRDNFKDTTDLKHYSPKTSISKLLFDFCINVYVEFLNNYKLTTKPSNYMILEIIRQYNQDVKEHNELYPQKKTQIEASKYAPIFSLMDAGYTFDTACEQSLISRSTKTRYKAELKKLGININAVLPHIIKSPRNFNDYQDFFEKYYDTFYKVYGQNPII